jgi:hypothetical protein
MRAMPQALRSYGAFQIAKRAMRCRRRAKQALWQKQMHSKDDGRRLSAEAGEHNLFDFSMKLCSYRLYTG